MPLSILFWNFEPTVLSSYRILLQGSVARYDATVPFPWSRIVKVSVLMDGLGAMSDGGGGAGVDDQSVRVEIIDENGTWIQSAYQTVLAGSERRWYDFTFSPLPSPVWDPDNVPPGGYRLLIRANPLDPGGTIRLWAYTPGTLPLGETQAAGWAVFLTRGEQIMPPDAEDLLLARLPWDFAQRALSATAPTGDASLHMRAGWHGTRTDGERGAVCIARRGGPATELVGERLLVVRDEGALPAPRIYLYCHAVGDVIEDLSMSRRAFMGLSRLADDDVAIKVEVLN